MPSESAAQDMRSLPLLKISFDDLNGSRVDCRVLHDRLIYGGKQSDCSNNAVG